jgi:ribosomal protein L19
MKHINYLILFGLFLFISSSGREGGKEESIMEFNTTDELIDNYSLEELEEVYTLKTKEENLKVLVINNELEMLNQKFNIDTLTKALKVIYGPDDRIDFYQETVIKKRKNSFGVVALVKKNKITESSNGIYSLSTVPFKDANNLCPKEPFVNQPIASFCSGFAISNNIIVTAGHCVKSEADLESIRFIFDFKAIDAVNVKTQFNHQLIFSGKRIISRGFDRSGFDYAIIETNETIPNSRILSLNRNSTVNNEEDVYVIGHPAGLPLKNCRWSKS